jgi:hypothetical protein
MKDEEVKLVSSLLRRPYPSGKVIMNVTCNKHVCILANDSSRKVQKSAEKRIHNWIYGKVIMGIHKGGSSYTEAENQASIALWRSFTPIAIEYNGTVTQSDNWPMSINGNLQYSEALIINSTNTELGYHGQGLLDAARK